MHQGLCLLDVSISRQNSGAQDLQFVTDGGKLRARYHEAPEDTPAVLWVFGSDGGLGGPAGGVYERLATRMVPAAASLQVDYRRPRDMRGCVLDVLLGIEFLKSRGHSRVVLVGHSFGGAVVVNAAIESPDVIGVVSLSPQTAGAGDPARIAPRPSLFIHGEADEVLPTECAVTLYHQAKEPKELILYPGCLHGLDQCRDELDRDLSIWLDAVLGTAAPIANPS